MVYHYALGQDRTAKPFVKYTHDSKHGSLWNLGFKLSMGHEKNRPIATSDPDSSPAGTVTNAYYDGKVLAMPAGNPLDLTQLTRELKNTGQQVLSNEQLNILMQFYEGPGYLTDTISYSGPETTIKLMSRPSVAEAVELIRTADEGRSLDNSEFSWALERFYVRS